MGGGRTFRGVVTLAAMLLLAAAMFAVAGEIPARAASYGSQETLLGPALNNPTGVAADAAGDVFVADTNNDQVVELPHGSTMWITLPFNDLSDPQYVAVDGSGDVFVTANVFDPGIRTEVIELVHGSNTQINRPFNDLSAGGLAVDAAGDVFVTDNGSNGPRVLELAQGSNTPTVLPFGFWGSEQPTGVAVDGAGDVFVNDPGTNPSSVPAGG